MGEGEREVDMGVKTKGLHNVIEQNGRLKALNEVAHRLKDAIRADWSLREFATSFVKEFCEPEITNGFTA